MGTDVTLSEGQTEGCVSITVVWWWPFSTSTYTGRGTATAGGPGDLSPFLSPCVSRTGQELQLPQGG